jgi:hypothetical protein
MTLTSLTDKTIRHNWTRAAVLALQRTPLAGANSVFVGERLLTMTDKLLCEMAGSRELAFEGSV